MAQDDIYLDAEQKLRRRIYYLITERTQKLGEDISKAIAELFAMKVRLGLLKFMNDDTYGPKDEKQGLRIAALSDGIKVEKSTSKKGGYKVTIRNDREGLLMYIEYGSGWLGDRFGGDGDSDEVGWEYMLNGENYVVGRNADYFIFHLGHTRSPDPFLTVQDEKPKKTEYIEVRPRKRRWGGVPAGTMVEHIHRLSPKKRENTIFSKGIKPQFIIFNARREVREFLKKHKTYQELKEALMNELVYEEV